MFKIGDKVSWQIRNSNRTNRRFEPSFYIYRGVIVDVSPLTAEFEYCGRDDQGNNVSKKGLETFRQLKNGKYISKQEDRDDPKGRLYLEIINGDA
jgi:hypothetical protein